MCLAHMTTVCKNKSTFILYTSAGLHKITFSMTDRVVAGLVQYTLL